MEASKSRPRPGAPPRLNQPTAVLEKLLAIELERLEVAVAIERERKIVFPETSVIIRDIMKLNAVLTPAGTDSLSDMSSFLGDLDSLTL